MTKFVNNLILLLVLLIAAAVNAGQIQIRMQKEVKISNTNITIGDIAWVNAADEKLRLRLETMVVAYKNSNQAYHTVTSFDIAKCLSEAGINPLGVDIYGSLECVVGFQGAAVRVQPVKIEKEIPANVDVYTIEDELNKQIADNSGFEPERLVIDWNGNKQELLQVEYDPVRYEIKPQRAVSLGNVRYMVTDNNPPVPEGVLPQHEKFYRGRPKTEYVNGLVKYISEYVVAKRDMKTGDILRDDDLKLVPQLVSSAAQIGVGSIEMLAGKELTRNINAEQVLKSNMVKRITLVNKNDPVYVRYNSSTVKISLKGFAMTDGSENDTIPVKVEHRQQNSTRKISQVIYCRVISSGEVVVIDGADDDAETQFAYIADNERVK